MLLNNLNLDSLRTLVLTQDLGGFGRAAERLGRTPSAISLQMRRLQEELGVALFSKAGRTRRLTEQGEIALRYSQKLLNLSDEMIDHLKSTSRSRVIRVGFAKEFSESVLPLAIAEMGASFSPLGIEITVDSDRILTEKVETGELDLALTFGACQKRTAHFIDEVSLHWIAGQGFIGRPDEPVPLALCMPPCSLRARALDALTDAGRSWRIVLTSPSLSGLTCAICAGIAVSPMSHFSHLQHVKVVDPYLPALGAVGIVLHRRKNQCNSEVLRFGEIVERIVRDHSPPPPCR